MGTATIIRKTATQERDAKITNEYITNGASTLDSIGKTYGLTRERVRQIVNKNNPGIEDIHQKRRAEAVSRHVATADKLVAADESIKTLKMLSDKIGVTSAFLKENKAAFAGSINIVEKRRKEYLVNLPRFTERSFSDEDIYEAVRYVSKMNGGKPITTEMYRTDHRTTDPSVSLIELRMGGIINACKGAGVAHNQPRKRRSIPKEEIISSIIACVEDLGLESVRLVSFVEYSEWAMENKRPSGSRVRQIFGNWNSAKMAVNAFQVNNIATGI